MSNRESSALYAYWVAIYIIKIETSLIDVRIKCTYTKGEQDVICPIGNVKMANFLTESVH